MKNSDPLYEEVRKKERLFTGSYLHLDRLTVLQPGNREALREVVKVRDAVAILPVDADNTVHLVRQHRPAIGKTILEIPAGVLDSEAESPETCARRECEEETGIVPGKLTRLMTYAHAEGYSTGFITLFLAQELTHTGKTHFDPSEHIEQVSLSYEKLAAMVRNNEIIDSKTILSVLLAKPFIAP